MDEDALALLVERANGDGRHVLTSLEVAVALAHEHPDVERDVTGAIVDERLRVSVNDVEAALGTKALRYGRDDHYDVISAFIKSIRGSDPDAGLYWLARMLEAGEDARFIARRLVILASEDIGMADSLSLVVADAAARAVEFVGLPEAQLNLAHAVVHLASAPKSNRVTVAIGRPGPTCGSGPRVRCLPHLRDAHYKGAKSLGHGKGYEYPHDDPSGWVDQEYRPAGLEGSVYYEPSSHGAEDRVRQRMQQRRHQSSDTGPVDAPGRRRRRGGRPVSALAVVLIVVAIVGLVVVAMAVQSLISTLRSLRETVDDLRRQTLPAIAELRATVAVANGELARVDDLLDTAEEVGARVEATSRLTWLVLRNPLVKLASASVASDRVARRLSRGDTGSERGDRPAVGPGSRRHRRTPRSFPTPQPQLGRPPRPKGGLSRCSNG